MNQDWFKEYSKVGNQPSLITIGGFDGVHIGHQKILHSMRKYQEMYPKTRVLVITFDPLPKQFFYPTIQPLIPLSERISKLYQHGADEVIVLPFSQKISSVSAEHFLNHFLVEHLKLHTLFLGPQHRFGKDGRGDIHFTTKMSYNLNFKVQEVSPVFVNNKQVSSSLIRQLKADNQNEEANNLLNEFNTIDHLILP